jgi:hypothetical protein
MKKLIIAGLAMALCLGVFSSKSMAADKDASWGIKLGYLNATDNMDVIGSADFGSSYAISGDYTVPMGPGSINGRLMYAPKFEATTILAGAKLDEELSYLQLAANYLWSPAKAEGAKGNWYVGGGLGWGRKSVDVDCIGAACAVSTASETKSSLDINLLGGYKFDNNFSVEGLIILDESVWGVNIGYNF